MALLQTASNSKVVQSTQLKNAPLVFQNESSPLEISNSSDLKWLKVKTTGLNWHLVNAGRLACKENSKDARV